MTFDFFMRNFLSLFLFLLEIKLVSNFFTCLYKYNILNMELCYFVKFFFNYKIRFYYFLLKCLSALLNRLKSNYFDFKNVGARIEL